MSRRRKRRGLADDLLDITSKLPWWVGACLAVASFVGMHFVASQQISHPASTAELGGFAVKNLYRSIAVVLQYVVPFICLAGALVSIVGQKKRERLVTQVAGSPSPASLGQMSWSEFEGLVQEAFRLRGYSVRRLGGEGPDGGVDLVLERGSEKTLVQCKQWRAQRVGVGVVRQLYGVMAAEGAAAGIVVTAGGFTPDAVEFARGRNVQLMAGPELFDMIRSVRSAPARATPTLAPAEPKGSGPVPGCPVCGSPMVRRQARQGVNAGQSFFGCSRYPACRGIVPID